MYPKELLLLILAILPCHASGNTPETFEEVLTMRPLRDGRVATRFSFTITQPQTPRSRSHPSPDNVHLGAQHYSLFPLSIGQVLREYEVTESHLSLNSGKWDYANWGYPDDPSVSTGAELWAWFGKAEDADIDEKWKGFRNALSGIFCASLGSLDELRTTSPNFAFQPEGVQLSPNTEGNHSHHFRRHHSLRHASLPSENVCTENLTPFIKLLPCKSSAGTASLLNPHRLFDADWHGMAIHVSSNDIMTTLQLSVQAVFDPVRLSAFKKRDFSMQSIFDRVISKSCPVASSSKVTVELPHDAPYQITPEPNVQGPVGLYDVADAQRMPLDVSVRYAEGSFSYTLEDVASLTDFDVVRSLTGTSQSHGRFKVMITNNHERKMEIVYVETMPWLLTFLLHTLEIFVDGRRHNNEEVIKHMSYTPPEVHGRPTLFEARLALPIGPGRTVELTMDVRKAFLRYTEHPPDAQRGWDLPAAVFVPVASVGNDTNADADSIATVAGVSHPHKTSGTWSWSRSWTRRIYTPSLLVDLATPDFSMPYNVIIMSSTLIALIFGSIFNLLTRRFILVSSEDGKEYEGGDKEERGGGNEKADG